MYRTPKDYLGNYCGMNNSNMNNSGTSFRDQSNNPFLYYINPINLSNPYICVQSCPKKSAFTNPSQAMCEYGSQPNDIIALVGLIQNGTCSSYTYATKSINNRCVPSEPIPAYLFSSLNNSISISAQKSPRKILNNNIAYSISVANDIASCWRLILICAFGAIFFTYLWTLILQYFVAIFVISF